MKKLLGILVLFAVSFSPVAAYDIFKTETSEPYEIVPLTIDVESRQSHMGELNDFPIMYEFEVKDKAVLSAKLQQKYTSLEPIKFGLMVVRKDDRGGGVTEVLRFNPHKEKWVMTKDKTLGITFLETNEISQPLDSGIYRIEVNTPDNKGDYILEIGDSSERLSYFEKLSKARNTQKHFGYSLFRMLASSLIYYPLGILILLFLLRKTWRYRKLITNAS